MHIHVGVLRQMYPQYFYLVVCPLGNLPQYQYVIFVLLYLVKIDMNINFDF